MGARVHTIHYAQCTYSCSCSLGWKLVKFASCFFFSPIASQESIKMQSTAAVNLNIREKTKKIFAQFHIKILFIFHEKNLWFD